MTGRGYKCCDCDTISDKECDWLIDDEYIKCLSCGSENVEPEDINKGVLLV